jgi:hypothetical protein
LRFVWQCVGNEDETSAIARCPVGACLFLPMLLIPIYTTRSRLLILGPLLSKAAASTPHSAYKVS